MSDNKYPVAQRKGDSIQETIEQGMIHNVEDFVERMLNIDNITEMAEYIVEHRTRLKDYLNEESYDII